MNTNATATHREFSKSVPLKDLAPRRLLPADIPLLIEWEKAKRLVKELDDYLKPKIQLTIDRHGVGTIVIGKNEILLAQSVRDSVSWKQVCEAVATPEAIAAVKPEYTTHFEIVSARVI